jgi:hypothetical protein
VWINRLRRRHHLFDPLDRAGADLRAADDGFIPETRLSMAQVGAPRGSFSVSRRRSRKLAATHPYRRATACYTKGSLPETQRKVRPVRPRPLTVGVSSRGARLR